MKMVIQISTVQNNRVIRTSHVYKTPLNKVNSIAIKEGWELPKGWHGFSQHSYETFLLPTKHISAREVLKFRDDAFHRYFENQAYLKMIEEKFGGKVKRHIQVMATTRLKRRLLGN